MDLSPLLSADNLVALAIDFGLLVLLAWFIILLLILREFRHFARQVVNDRELDRATYDLCQQSVDQALNYTADNNDTLNDLIIIQQALESQVSQIKAAKQDLSEQEQASINELNQKLNKSHRLIKKLKGDLDISVKGLKRAKGKLMQQNDTVESLQMEKQQLEKQFEQLEQEYIQISESGGVDNLAKAFQQEKQQLLEKIEQYQSQLSAKGDTEALAAELEASQQQLHHLNKEKEFVEKKYLELLNEAEKKPQ
ncbi:chromosome partitioning protein ParA [Vibrio sp. JPW-9-11-11]|uniref:chromosome partitioning protein ParA n=1 Tax=Vibrio sp. JPW-9-11-11 TaxID=1416532 RepID=UPI0015932649|nr:chromosome partitioning protein ParA [Vibrio sp. JPW-9-11-11]NVD08116.1 chromosome partitioning protein ParA [Vibrio sp. JPW-9-11-11]